MLRALSVFLAFLLIIFVVPYAGGINPAPLNKRLEFSRDLLDDWITFEEVCYIREPDWTGDFWSDMDQIGYLVRDFVRSFGYALYVPISDFVIITRIVGVWLTGYIPTSS